MSELIAKINEMTIMENEKLDDKMMKRAIDLLKYTKEKGISIFLIFSRLK